MTRVASLYLPDWSIDRVRRAERPHAPPERTGADDAFDAIERVAAAERAVQCSVPKEGGWRPGARWARSDPDAGGSDFADTRAGVAMAIEALPVHQRPPMRELGRMSVAAEHPFARTSERRPSASPCPATLASCIDSGAEAALPFPQRAPLRELGRRTEAAAHPFRAMSPDDGGRGALLPGKTGSGSTMRVRSRHGHRGEAGFIAPPSLAQLAAMPAVQFPGEGPHPDDYGKSEPTSPSYGKGRFFQTGRTLGDVVARVVPDGPKCVDPNTALSDEPPLVTSRKDGSRVLVAAANAAARALGIAPGLALTQARAQVAGLEVRAADPDGDRAALDRLALTLARRWTPVVAVSDVDGLFLDLTGVAHLHGGEERLARRLVRLLARHGVAARVAIADTAGAAWALARFGTATSMSAATTRVLPGTRGPKPGGNGQGAIGWAEDARARAIQLHRQGVTIVDPGRHAAAIAPLPVEALRLDAPALELLARLGVDTVERLAALPRAPLVRRLGKAAVRRLDQAIGAVAEPFDPMVPAEPIVVDQRFAEPIATAEAIAHWLGELTPRLATGLAEAGVGARLVELVAERVDGNVQRLTIGLARPTRDAAHMLRLVVRRIEQIEPGFGIDALALHVRRADPLGPQSLATELAEPATPDLAPLVDALANRIGEHRLWRALAVESDVPERSVARASPLDAPARGVRALGTDDVQRLDQRPSDHPWHTRWPRPIRLLRRPELLDNVMAMMPDRPPVRFTWRGHIHRVLRADGPERIGGEWWRRPAERLAIRDYFHVEDEAGQRFWLYRSGDGVRAETGDLRWFLHGTFG